MNGKVEVTSHRDKLNDKVDAHTGDRGNNKTTDHSSFKNKSDCYRKPHQDQQRHRGRIFYPNNNVPRSKYDNNCSYSKQINDKTVRRNENLPGSSTANSSTHSQNRRSHWVVTSEYSREGELTPEQNHEINPSKTKEIPSHSNRNILNDGLGQSKTSDKSRSFSNPTPVSEPVPSGNNTHYWHNQRYSHNDSKNTKQPNYSRYNNKNYRGSFNNSGGNRPVARGTSGGRNNYSKYGQGTSHNTKSDRPGRGNSNNFDTNNDHLGISWPYLCPHKDNPNVNEGNNKIPSRVKDGQTDRSMDSTVNSSSTKRDKSTDKELMSSSDSDRSKQDNSARCINEALSPESKNSVIIKKNTDDDLCKPPCIFSSESNSFKDKCSFNKNPLCLSKSNSKTNALLVDVNKALECGSTSSTSEVSQYSLKSSNDCSPALVKDCTNTKDSNGDIPSSSNSHTKPNTIVVTGILKKKPCHSKDPAEKIEANGDKSTVEKDKKSLNSNTVGSGKINVSDINTNKNSSKNESGNTDKSANRKGKNPLQPNDKNKPKKRKKIKREPKGSIYTIGLRLKDSFDDQARSMINQFEMKPRERACVDVLKDDLYRLFSPIIPNLELVLFGSMIAGTAFSNSDVDISLKCFAGFPCQTVQEFIVKFYRVIYQGGYFYHVVKIANARVPILKAVHSSTGFRVDVSFLTDSNEPHYGSSNSILVKHLCCYDQRVRNLIMLVLFWAKHHGFVGKYQFSSFTFILLAIFYLQIVEILPPLYKLIPIGEEECTWPTSFNGDVTLLHNSNTETLESLYLGFFSFFSAVRFDEVVISVYAGELVLGVLFETPYLLPSCFSGYRRLVEGGHMDPLTKSIMCVQEPFNLSWNTVRGVNASITDRLKHGCHNVCNTFAKFSSNRALSVVHSQYQYAEDEDDSYSWQLPCPHDLVPSDWFKRVLRATRRVFTDILLMDIDDGNRQYQFDGINFSTFYYSDDYEENPVRLIVSTDYSVASNQRSKLVLAYKNTSYSEYEKEIKASALFLESLKKNGTKNGLDETIFIARHEKNGSVEITVNKYSNKRIKQGHKVFVNYLRNDNFKHFLGLMLGLDSCNKSDEGTSSSKQIDISSSSSKTLVTKASQEN